MTQQLNTRLLQEVAMGIANSTIIEFSRVTLDLSPQSRGFLFMYYGLFVIALQVRSRRLSFTYPFNFTRAKQIL
jgi:hypothetical protein